MYLLPRLRDWGYRVATRGCRVAVFCLGSHTPCSSQEGPPNRLHTQLIQYTSVYKLLAVYWEAVLCVRAAAGGEGMFPWRAA